MERICTASFLPNWQITVAYELTANCGRGRSNCAMQVWIFKCPVIFVDDIPAKVRHIFNRKKMYMTRMKQVWNNSSRTLSHTPILYWEKCVMIAITGNLGGSFWTPALSWSVHQQWKKMFLSSACWKERAECFFTVHIRSYMLEGKSRMVNSLHSGCGGIFWDHRSRFLVIYSTTNGANKCI